MWIPGVCRAPARIPIIMLQAKPTESTTDRLITYRWRVESSICRDSELQRSGERVTSRSVGSHIVERTSLDPASA